MYESRTIYEVPDKYGPLFPWVYKKDHEELACMLTWPVLVLYVLLFGWQGLRRTIQSNPVYCYGGNHAVVSE